MDYEEEKAYWDMMYSDGNGGTVDDWGDEEHEGHMDGLATLDEDGPYSFAKPHRGDGTMRQIKRQHYRKPRGLIDILYPIPF